MGHGPLELWASLIDELTWRWVKPMGLSGDGLLLTMGLSGDKDCWKIYQLKREFINVDDQDEAIDNCEPFRTTGQIFRRYEIDFTVHWEKLLL